MTYYTLVIDFGIPYEVKVYSEQGIIFELEELRDQIKDIDYPFLDIWIYNEQDQDITEDFFNKNKVII